jgi:histidine ammonia-lyase
MGSNAALITKKVIDNSFEVIAIQMMTVVQAIDYLGCVPRLSRNTCRVYEEIRKIFPKFIEDKPKYKDLEKLKAYFEQASPVISFHMAMAK